MAYLRTLADGMRSLSVIEERCRQNLASFQDPAMIGGCGQAAENKSQGKKVEALTRGKGIRQVLIYWVLTVGGGQNIMSKQIAYCAEMALGTLRQVTTRLQTI